MIKRLKKGSPVGTLFHSNQPNKSFQDGWKGEYLCLTCENDFSKIENWFCQNVYEPFDKHRAVTFQYGVDLKLFVASLMFRYLDFLQVENPTKPMAPALVAAKENLRNALLAKDATTVSFPLYMEFFPTVSDLRGFPPGINTYFFESIGGRAFNCPVPTGEFWIACLKVPGMFFVLSTQDLAQLCTLPDQVNATRIELSGAMTSSNGLPVLSPFLQDVFVDGALTIQEDMAQRPQPRMDKIAAKIKAAGPHENTRAGQSYLMDQHLLNELVKEHKAEKSRSLD